MKWQHFVKPEFMTFTFMHHNVKYRAPGVMDYGSQPIPFLEICYAHPLLQPACYLDPVHPGWGPGYRLEGGDDKLKIYLHGQLWR